jgi:hypothetical protein
MWGEDSERHSLPIACDAERSLSNAWRQINRRTQGQQNAWKHGYYGATAKAERSRVRDLLKDAASLRKRVFEREI